jgi:flagellar biosynthesis protein FlhF
MQTKTFKSDTMLQTLQLVQAELGAAAIVVSVREVPLGPVWDPWKKAGVEVQATVPEPETAPKAVAPASVLQPVETSPGPDFAEERPEIEWELSPQRDPSKLPPPLKLNLAPLPGKLPPTVEPVSKTATQAAASAGDRFLSPALKKIQGQLIQQGVESSLIENLVSVVLETLSPTTLADPEACKKSITELMGASLRIQKGAGTFVSNQIICLVGASGSGKTSAIAKLALFFSQRLQKTVTWVCADTVRTGAVAEARAYTDALGLNLKLVYTPADLEQILSNPEKTDLFLVDTPGYNPCSEGQMGELGALLLELPKRCTYLVAPATTKESDLFQAAAALGIFNLDGVIFTKLDETHTFGSLYNLARKTQLPLSFLTTGKEAARHLEVADPARLVAALFGREWSK